eukprot:CAMPEP_0198202290 /NCGR_PEP_ID=MMETSP1445-20131203/5424_1 /TAXON_ID=36898 /ORGANISM="Pyramimonas sp., Strain CCMP2087" /LENGTH=173 /DNA_ID=CAMNT_0043873131 /DNA_START=705 /DNA_END=1226 /DNA_ORIENTATION=-
MDLALLCITPLLASLALFLRYADDVPAVGEVRDLLQTVVSMLAELPMWGLALLAAGAGLGEEVFFRALLQNGGALVAAQKAGLAAPLADQVGLWSASLLFGLAHAVTPLYFLWATFAGALFGWEYLSTGSLGAAVTTHFLYDWLAFVYLVNDWKRNELSSGQAALRDEDKTEF